MVLEQAISMINPPWFIALLVILSYFIWSKFFNKEEFKMNDINDVLDILSISVLIFLEIFSFLFMLILLNDTIRVNGNNPNVFSTSWSSLVWIIPIICLFFLANYRNYSKDNKNPKKDLEKIFLYILSINLFCLLAFFGFFLIINFFSYGIFVKSHLFGILLFVLLISIFAWTLMENLFKNKYWSLSDKKQVLRLFYFILFGFIVSLFFIPLIHQENFQPIEYHTYDFGSNYPKYYVYGRVPTRIFSLGLAGSSIIPVISTNLEVDNFNLSDLRVTNNFVLKINTTEKEYTLLSSYSSLGSLKIEEFGINNIILENKTLGVIYNRKDILKINPKNIVFYGIVPIDLSQEVNYTKKIYKDSCSKTNCSFNWEIQNRLEDLPLNIRDSYILANLDGFNIENKEACKLDKISIIYRTSKSDLDYYEQKCEGNRCDIMITKKIGDNYEEVLKAQFVLNSNLIEQYYSKIMPRSNFDFALLTEC